VFRSRTCALRLPPKSAPPPEFFVDRSLGRRMVPEALRGLGVVVHTMADTYPGGENNGGRMTNRSVVGPSV
jgi:hypothetical protein